MNWKNVLFLVRVERKSGRLIRGIKATRYRENGFLAYWPYWTAVIIGVLAGLLANYFVSQIYSNGAVPNLPSLRDGTLSVFVILPTIILVFSLVFTLLQQIQLSGVKASTQVMYWLPVTWQEHTVASIFANLLGFPLAVVLGLAAGVVTFSIPNGLILQALLTMLALFAAAFMASATTESLRILQVRFIGAVYKSSGRAAVWVRFIGSILFFIIFYILYFYVTSGFTSFLTEPNARSERSLVRAFRVASPNYLLHCQRVVFARRPIRRLISIIHCRLVLPCCMVEHAVWALRASGNNGSKKRHLRAENWHFRQNRLFYC